MLILTSFSMIGQMEILMIIGAVLVLFGGAKIPQLMRGLGRGMGEFQAGIHEGKKLMDEGINHKMDFSKDEPIKKDDLEAHPKPLD